MYVSIQSDNISPSQAHANKRRVSIFPAFLQPDTALI